MEVICRDTVKPSSPTPHHLRRLKISYLDQLMADMYIPVVFFYESKGPTAVSNQARICQQMKRSLSDILTAFYPLAGSVEPDHLGIDCNDAGVEFVEARSPGINVSEAMDSATEELKQYFPMDDVGGRRPVLSLQITCFACGGIALGVYFSHAICDCSSILRFLNAWAAACRGEQPPELSPPVTFDLADYFPARDLPHSIFAARDTPGRRELGKTKLVFDKKTSAHLREAAAGSRVHDPTRVELISAFIWRHFAEMERLKNPNSPKALAAVLLVNLRGRKGGLGNVFGNCVMTAFTYTENMNDDDDLDLVSEVRKSIRRVDEGYITEAQSGNNYIDDLSRAYSVVATGEVEVCRLTSWWRFPIYDVDYGFGGPSLFRYAGTNTDRTLLLASSKVGDDIDAWVWAEEDELEMLQTKFNLIISR